MAFAHPLFQHVGEVAELEEILLGIFFHRGGAADHRHRVFQLGGVVGGAADFAVVAILVFGAALGAGSLDEAIRQKHFRFRVVGLLDGAGVNVAGLAQFQVNLAGDGAVFFRMGAVVIIETNQKIGKIHLVFFFGGRNQLLRGNAILFGAQHDGRAVGVIGAHINAVVAAQALEPGPDVGLDVLHQMTKMNRPVGVGQGAGDEDFAAV